MFTPLTRDDHAWVRKMFRREPGAAVYSDSWLYLTQACRGALGALGAYYRHGSFFVGLGRHAGHWVLVRPVGNPPDGFLADLRDFISEGGAEPVVFVKKPGKAFLAALAHQADALNAKVLSDGEYPWDPSAPTDDDTFPEYVIDTAVVAGLPHATGRRAQRLRSKLRQCVELKPTRMTLDMPGAEAALRRFLRNHFDQEPENALSSYDNMIGILASKDAGWLWHDIVLDDEGEVVGFFAYEELDQDSVGVYASVVSRAVTGLSERLMVEFMEQVSGRYRWANLGGSETAALDQYKKKYADGPGRKNPLVAVDLSPGLPQTSS